MATERKRAYAQALAAVRQGMLDSEKERSLPAFGRGLTACPSLWALLSTTTLYGAQRLGRVLGSVSPGSFVVKDLLPKDPGRRRAPLGDQALIIHNFGKEIPRDVVETQPRAGEFPFSIQS